MKTKLSLTPFLLIAALCLSWAPLSASYRELPDPFTQAELDQMLAPIALYPDVLLAQILIAATYPLEVVQAARWSRANPGLEGEVAVNAASNQDWDLSVKSLVAFPRLLQQMDDDLGWTQRIGDAFLMQEEQVMDTIQHLRERARIAGTLEKLENVRVQRTREVIIIEPANPRVVYVPYYRPTVVYGSWWWPAHPPVYWSAPPGFYGASHIYWGRSITIHSGFYWCSWDWPRRQIVVVHPRPRVHRPVTVIEHHHHHHYHRWRHDPWHRRGVAYRNQELAREFARPRTDTPPIASPRTSEREHRAVAERFRGRETAEEVRQRISERRTTAASPSESPARSWERPSGRTWESNRDTAPRNEAASRDVWRERRTQANPDVRTERTRPVITPEANRTWTPRERPDSARERAEAAGSRAQAPRPSEAVRSPTPQTSPAPFIPQQRVDQARAAQQRAAQTARPAVTPPRPEQPARTPSLQRTPPPPPQERVAPANPSPPPARGAAQPERRATPANPAISNERTERLVRQQRLTDR
ncbi:MAG: DUF3300 domain-containing protein [Puniceicoccaceae bacterium]|nr:MAG: DUF3300 domain-containing protein [Puniceicoccaceae bacterium]